MGASLRVICIPGLNEAAVGLKRRLVHVGRCICVLFLTPDLREAFPLLPWCSLELRWVSGWAAVMLRWCVLACRQEFSAREDGLGAEHDGRRVVSPFAQMNTGGGKGFMVVWALLVPAAIHQSTAWVVDIADSMWVEVLCRGWVAVCRRGQVADPTWFVLRR